MVELQLIRATEDYSSLIENTRATMGQMEVQRGEVQRQLKVSMDSHRRAQAHNHNLKNELDDALRAKETSDTRLRMRTSKLEQLEAVLSQSHEAVLALEDEATELRSRRLRDIGNSGHESDVHMAARNRSALPGRGGNAAPDPDAEVGAHALLIHHQETGLSDPRLRSVPGQLYVPRATCAFVECMLIQMCCARIVCVVLLLSRCLRKPV